MPVEGILDHCVTLSYPRHLREEYKQHSRDAMIFALLLDFSEFPDHVLMLSRVTIMKQ